MNGTPQRADVAGSVTGGLAGNSPDRFATGPALTHASAKEALEKIFAADSVAVWTDVKG